MFFSFLINVDYNFEKIKSLIPCCVASALFLLTDRKKSQGVPIVSVKRVYSAPSRYRPPSRLCTGFLSKFALGVGLLEEGSLDSLRSRSFLGSSAHLSSAHLNPAQPSAAQLSPALPFIFPFSFPVKRSPSVVPFCSPLQLAFPSAFSFGSFSL